MDQGSDEEWEDWKDFREELKPSAWNAAWEQAQGAVVPSKEIKRAANILVWCEQAQQSMGWLLLTQIGVLLGSFGQLMSPTECLLSWGIFTLEAILKYARSWAHSLYFRGVPCAIVALHDNNDDNNDDTASASLRVFGYFVLLAPLLEVLPYAFYVRFTVKFLLADWHCYDEGAGCPDGTTSLMDMRIISMAIVCVHWFSSLGTVLAFGAAMGMGISARARDSSSWFRHLSPFVRKRDERDQLMRLTWWVHMARHRHLTPVVASTQPCDCGLPGHWFKSKDELFRIVEECDKGDHVHLDTSRLLWVSQEMALRALISLAKQKKLGEDDDFALLVRVVRDGRTESCRGLAATAIAVLATQPDVLPLSSLIESVVPLKRLARSEAVEHVEVALGALLNASLQDNSRMVINLILESNILDSDEVGSSFMSCLIGHAHIGKSTLCQELAVRLLSCLVGSREGKRAREAVMSYKGEQGKVPGFQLCTALIKHGVSSPIKAGGAAVLAEIAYWADLDFKGSDRHIEECVQALVDALEATTSKLTILSAAKALCSLAYKNQDSEATLVNKAQGIRLLVALLNSPLPDSGLHDNNSQITRKEYNRSTVTRKRHLEVDVRSDDIRSEAARALRILALNDPEHQMQIAEAGAIPLLIDLMASKNPNVQVQAMAALSGISFQIKFIQDMIGKEGIGKEGIFLRLKSVLNPNERDDRMAEAILEKVAHLIISLIEDNESNRHLALNQGVREQLQDCIDNTKRYYKDNGKAIHSAKRALKILSEEQLT